MVNDMNVRELIAELQNYDGDMKVSIRDKEGFLCEVDYSTVQNTDKPYCYVSQDLRDQDKILELGN